RVQVAGSNRGPLVIHHRDLAVERAGAVLADAYAVADQLPVQGPRGHHHRGHVRLALQDRAHVHAAPGGPTQVPEEAMAGEEVRVGDHDPPFRATDGLAVDLLDIGAAPLVVAHDECGLGGPLGVTGSRRIALGVPDALVQHEAVDIAHHRTADL